MNEIVNVETLGQFVQESADHLEYRGRSVDFYEDPYGRQVYTICSKSRRRLYFGTDNTQYKEDMKALIDSELDVVRDFSDKYPGTRLVWKKNGTSKDLMLLCWKRILRVYPFTTCSVEMIEIDAEQFLKAHQEYFDEFK